MDQDRKPISTGEVLTVPSGVSSSDRRGSVHERSQPANGSVRTEPGSVPNSPGSVADGQRTLCPLGRSGRTRPAGSSSEIGSSDVTRSRAQRREAGRLDSRLVGCPQQRRARAASLQGLATTSDAATYIRTRCTENLNCTPAILESLLRRVQGAPGAPSDGTQSNHEEPVKRQGAEVGRMHPVYEAPRPGGVLSPCPRETCFSGRTRAPRFGVAAGET